jgi:hypothetical protein
MPLLNAPPAVSFAKKMAISSRIALNLQPSKIIILLASKSIVSWILSLCLLVLPLLFALALLRSHLPLSAFVKLASLLLVLLTPNLGRVIPLLLLKLILRMIRIFTKAANECVIHS